MDKKYKCPKHGIVEEKDHLTIDITGLEGNYCLICYGEWIKANITKLIEVDEEKKEIPPKAV